MTNPRIRISCVSLVLILSALLQGCGTASIESEAKLIHLYATAASQTWLEPAYDCARESNSIIYLSEPQSAEVILRVGEPDKLSTPAYLIGMEEILIVTHLESPLQNLTGIQARLLFAGQGDTSVQIWVYPAGEDVQQVFDREVMGGRPITSMARLAVNPQQMVDTLNAEVKSVGILTRHWKIGDSREIYSLGSYPVLAITKTQAEGAIKDLIGCLQK